MIVRTKLGSIQEKANGKARRDKSSSCLRKTKQPLTPVQTLLHLCQSTPTWHKAVSPPPDTPTRHLSAWGGVSDTYQLYMPNTLFRCHLVKSQKMKLEEKQEKAGQSGGDVWRRNSTQSVLFRVTSAWLLQSGCSASYSSQAKRTIQLWGKWERDRERRWRRAESRGRAGEREARQSQESGSSYSYNTKSITQQKDNMCSTPNHVSTHCHSNIDSCSVWLEFNPGN